MESPRFEMVVLELHTRGLAASVVEEIEYNEYIASKAGDTHINKWKQKLKRFGSKPATIKSRASKFKSIILYSIIALIVLAILILNPQCPRRF
jgi:hypothetical protein